MKITNLILIPSMILAFSAFAPAIATTAAQSYDQDKNYAQDQKDLPKEEAGRGPSYSQDQKDLPGVDAGRGPSYSSPQVEESPLGGRESQYPPYHQDTH